MFGAGVKEGDSTEIHIKGTTSVAFKALLEYLYTDNMEMDDAVVFDLAHLCAQYRVERLFNHCLKQLDKGTTVQNAVFWLLQAHTAGGEGGGTMWGKLRSMTMGYVTSNFKKIWRDARRTLELLDRAHPELYKQLRLSVQKAGTVCYDARSDVENSTNNEPYSWAVASAAAITLKKLSINTRDSAAPNKAELSCGSITKADLRDWAYQAGLARLSSKLRKDEMLDVLKSTPEPSYGPQMTVVELRRSAKWSGISGCSNTYKNDLLHVLNYRYR
jgi:hypothetical protein